MSGRQRTQRGCITLQPPRMMPDGLEVRASTLRVVWVQRSHTSKSVWVPAGPLRSLASERAGETLQEAAVRWAVVSISLSSPLLSSSSPSWAVLTDCCPQVSLHTCPRALLRELDHVFPGVDLDACLAIPTNQKAVMDLVAMGDTVETEKDVLLNSVRRGWQICCLCSGTDGL